MIATYVENDYGFGLGLALPGRKFSRRIQALELPGFPLVDFGLVWRGEPTHFLKAFISEVQRRAHMFSIHSAPEAGMRSPARQSAARVSEAEEARP